MSTRKTRAESGSKRVACTVCAHPKLAEIDRAMTRGMSAGSIVARNGSLTLEAVRRHAAGHPSDGEWAATQAAKKAHLETLQREARMLAEVQRRGLRATYGVRG